MKVAVLGSGAGALAVAADMSRHGRHTVMAGFDDHRAGLEPVAGWGEVLVSRDGQGEVLVSRDGRGGVRCPVTVADSAPEALDGAELVVVAVPCSAHERGVQAIAPHTTPDQTVLFVGEASGAIVARRSIEPPTVVAEANTLPCAARSTGPGAVSIVGKPGGVLIAALPPTPPSKARVMELIGDVWPCAAATDTVWTTVLAGYDAIENLATASVIEAVDAELLALRRPLNSRETRGYHDFLVAQGLTPGPAPAPDPGPAPAPDPGPVTADVPCALVLASSLGQAAGVPTPETRGLVTAASARLGHDSRAGGRTLASLGLDGLDVTGLIGFARTGMFP